MWVYLESESNSVLLRRGETVVGRGLTCDVRFNDVTISRAHARFIVDEEGAEVEDLGTTNGTLVNGERIRGRTRLRDGDEIVVGRCRLSLRLTEDPDQLLAEETMDRTEEWTGVPEDPPIAVGRPVLPAKPVELPQIQHKVCHQCRTPMPLTSRQCPTCGVKARDLRPLSVTQRISIKDLRRPDRRQDQRHLVEIPLLYSSDTLAFDALTRDLSRGGVFVASELLDPVGTRCVVTLLPDGAPPLSAEGEVCHVVSAEGGEAGRPPGMGIRFTRLGPRTHQWVDQAIRRLSPS